MQIKKRQGPRRQLFVVKGNLERALFSSSNSSVTHTRSEVRKYFGHIRACFLLVLPESLFAVFHFFQRIQNELLICYFSVIADFDFPNAHTHTYIAFVTLPPRCNCQISWGHYHHALLLFRIFRRPEARSPAHWRFHGRPPLRLRFKAFYG